MAGPATILREIHRLRRHAKELQAEIDRGPRLLKAQQAKIARQEQIGADGQDALKRLKVNYHEKEVSLKTAHQQIAKHQKQLNESGSKKEYDALKGEIADDQKKCKAFEDEMLECLSEIEEKTAQIPELEKGIQKARQDYVELEKNANARLAGLQEDLRRTTEQLKEIEQTLPPDVRPLYDRLVSARGEDAMAAVENRTCRACYTEITAQNYNDLVLSQFVPCKSCGRVLYLAE